MTAWRDVLTAAGFPAEAIVLDFETYFDADYSLKKMPIVEFVKDSRFVCTSLAWKLLGGTETRFINGGAKGYYIDWYLKRLVAKYGKQLEGITVVGQNLKFDAMVLQEVFGITPKFTVDTMDLDKMWDARAKHSLAELSKRWCAPTPKGDTKQFIGKRWEEFAPEEQANARAYNINDVEIEAWLFEKMMPITVSRPEVELPVANHTLQMFLTPGFEIDMALGKEIVAGMKSDMQAPIDALRQFDLKITDPKKRGKPELEPRDVQAGDISRDSVFVGLVEQAGGSVPMKRGKKRDIPALAKADEGLRDLLTSGNSAVRTLALARQAVQSWPLHLAKVESILRQAASRNNRLGTPLGYHNAHCVSGDTEIMTKAGWVRLDQWSGGDIAQWDGDKGTIIFAKAAPNRYVVDEPVVRMSAPRASGVFTKGHCIPWFTYNNILHTSKAGECRRLEKLPLSGRLIGSFLPNEQARVLMMVQADGCWKIDSKHNSLVFGFRKRRKIERCKWLLQQAGVSFKLSVESSSTTRISVRRKSCPEWLTPERKLLGQWCLNYDPMVLVDEAKNWDGHDEANSDGWSWSSCDEQSAIWLQTLAHLSGKAASLRRVSKGHEGWRDTFKVFVTNCSVARINKGHWSEESFNGVVYCPSTITGFWLMRHAGRIQVTGNTGRWGGAEKINLQNMGGTGRGKGTHPLIRRVRNMLRAPKGYVLGINDYSKVEAVGSAWQAGQKDLLEAFRTGSDVYSELATELFGFPVRKPKKCDPKPIAARLEICRGFGKDAILGCLAYGTPILTDTGFKPIENVSLVDKLWDGCEWVRHYGVIYKGGKLCVEVNGVWMTPEHEVWTPGGWTTAAELSTNSRTLEKHTAPLQLLASNVGPAAGSSPSNVAAPVVESLLRGATIWSLENLHAVLSVLKRHPGKLRAMTLPSRSRIAHACLTEFVRLLADVKPGRIPIMASEVSECGAIGSEIESLFLNTWSRCLGGMTHNLTSTELTIIGDMNLVISDSLRGSRICETADILNSGPSHRFQARNLIVSNCGYGMGAKTFYERCYANDALRPKFDDGTFDMPFIEKVIRTYRTRFSKIPAYWSRLEKSWRWATKYKEKIALDDCGLEFFHKDDATFIRLPSGRLQRYPHAAVSRDNELRYHWGTIYGGALTENVVSALCRDFIAESILRLIANGFWVVLTVHDEIVCLLEEKNAESRLKEMAEIMTDLPAWATGFPLSVDGCLTPYYKK